MWKFEVHKDEVGRWRWRLVARNAVIVLESPESYDRRVDATRAAEAVRAEIFAAPIISL